MDDERGKSQDMVDGRGMMGEGRDFLGALQ